MGWVLLIQLSPNGGVFVLAVRGSAESPLGGDLASLVERARASSPPQPTLPWFREGEVVEPRAVRGVADLSDPASTSTWSEPPPRRSMRQERELRQLAAFSAFVRQSQQARTSPRRAREAWQLQQVLLLAAALRRAGFPR
jgi:hypothetical protein